MRTLLWSIAAIGSMASAAIGQAAAVPLQQAVDRREPAALDELRLFWENDARFPWNTVGSDRYYTNGLRLAGGWSRGASTDDDLPRLLRHFSRRYRCMAQGIQIPGDWCRVAHQTAVGQNMYTPRNIRLIVPDPLDRPYAGFTYVSQSLSLVSPIDRDFLELQLGLLGDWSGADRVQRFWHREVSTGSPRPEGWEYGLPSEFGVILRYERAHVPDPRRFLRVNRHGQRWFDLHWRATAAVGNVFTQAGLGGGVRLGHNLPGLWPDRIGPTRLRTIFAHVDPQASVAGDRTVNLSSNGQRLDWSTTTPSRINATAASSAGTRWTELYGFAGFEGRAVAYNAMLEGNLFADHPCRRESGDEPRPCVSTEPFIGDVEVGLGIRLWRIAATYRRVYRSREFDGGGAHRYNAGSIAFVGVPPL